MPLQWQPVHVNFGEGVDTFTDAKAVVSTKLLKAQNVVFTSPGALRTRFGWASAGTKAGARRLVKRGNELLALGDSNVIGGPTNQYTSGMAGVARQPVIREAGYTATDVDCALYGNIVLTMTRLTKDGTSKITVTVSELDTGRTLQRTESLIADNATMPRCVAVDHYIWMFYLDAAGAGLRARRYDATANTFGADTLVLINVTGKFDLWSPARTEFMLACQVNPGVPTIDVYRLNASLTGLALGTVAVQTSTPIAIMGTPNETAYLAYRNDGTGALEVSGFSMPGLVGTFTGATIFGGYPGGLGYVQVALGRVSATACKVIYQNDNGAGLCVDHKDVSNVGVVDPTTSFTWARQRLQSKPWVYNDIMHALVGYSDGLQGTSYVMTFPFDPSQTSAIISRGVAGVEMRGTLPQAPQTDTPGVFRSALLTKQRVLASRAVDTFSYAAESIGSDLLTFDHVSSRRYCTAELGGLTYIAGGILKYYDGTIIGEVGFMNFPQQPVGAATAGGGIDLGAHDYVVIWSYTDSQGNVHRSAPSPALRMVIAPGAQQVNLTVTPLDMSMRELVAFGPFPSRVIAEWYGTLHDSAGPYYRIKPPSESPVNEPSAVLITYASPSGDTDATISQRPALYTSGGALPNLPPPSTDFVFVHKNRLIVISSEDGTIWFSKEYIPGEAPGFNDVFTFKLPTSEMPVAGVSFDSKAIIWTKNEIHVLSGEFPSDSGAGSTLDSQRIASDVGATDWRSIALTHEGAYFASVKGIFLLTRGLQVQFAGADVAYWTDNYSDITATLVTPDRDEVRFHVRSPVAPVATPTGQTLVLNFRAATQASPFGQWSTFDDALGDTVSALVIDGAIYRLTSSGALYTETDAYSDNGAWITVDVETANIYPFGRQAAARFRSVTALGKSQGTHASELQIAYDDEPVFVESAFCSAADLALLDTEHVSHHLIRQKGSGIRAKITTYQDGAAPNAGVTLSGIVLEAAQKRGTSDRGLPKEARQ